MLTSDHGFDVEISKTLNVEQVLKKTDRNIQVLNEGRFASIYFPGSWRGESKTALMQDLGSHPQIDLVAYRDGDKVFVQSHSQEVMMAYGPSICKESNFSVAVFELENHLLRAAGTPLSCPENMDGKWTRLYYPYFLSNLSRYFQSPGHPDALIIPKPGVAFKNLSRGQHGGPTLQEAFVPLLIHNGKLDESANIPALWDLLKFM